MLKPRKVTSCILHPTRKVYMFLTAKIENGCVFEMEIYVSIAEEKLLHSNGVEAIATVEGNEKNFTSNAHGS